MVSGELAFLVVAHRRRRGSGGSPRGANRLIADAVATTRRLPDMEGRKILLWSDSAYYGHPSISAEITAGADVSVTARMTSTVNEDTGRWISSAEVTEIPFTAFASKNKTHQVPDRLAVRRIPELNKQNVDQPGLFDLHRFHAVFTTSDPGIVDTMAADKTHRQHAAIEQVNPDPKASVLAHMPSGKFTANAYVVGVGGHGIQPNPHGRGHCCGGDGQGLDRNDPMPDHSCGDPGGAWWSLPDRLSFFRLPRSQQFVEQPEQDVIWRSRLPENLGGARLRYHSFTEGTSVNPGLTTIADAAVARDADDVKQCCGKVDG